MRYYRQPNGVVGAESGGLKSEVCGECTSTTDELTMVVTTTCPAGYDECAGDLASGVSLSTMDAEVPTSFTGGSGKM